MAYWGSGVAENDFAFDGVGAYVVLIRNRMIADGKNVVRKRYPEQSILASLRCLRLLDAEFPKCVRVSFRKKHLKQAQELFEEWYALVSDRVPQEFRDSVRESADAEFAAYRAQLGATSSSTPPHPGQ